MPRWSPAAPSPSAGVSSCACSRPAVCGSPSAGTRGCCTRRPSRRGCLRAAGSTSSPHARTDRPPALPSSASWRTQGSVLVVSRHDGGLDLPSRAVGDATAEEALGELQREVLGDQEGAELVGYVRNTVPAGDTSYPWPVPRACFAVYAREVEARPFGGATGSPSTRPPNASPRGTGGYCCPSSSATRGTGTVAGRERGGDQLAGRERAGRERAGRERAAGGGVDPRGGLRRREPRRRRRGARQRAGARRRRVRRPRDDRGRRGELRARLQPPACRVVVAGGYREPGRVRETVVREVLEETGLLLDESGAAALWL